MINLTDYKNMLQEIGENAKFSSQSLKRASTYKKNKALVFASEHLKENINYILAENKKDLTFAEKKQISKSLIDRMILDESRVYSIIQGLQKISTLPDPVGKKINSREMPNGLKINRIQVPIGVIGIIYESRPNVTADAGALCLKSGNAAILRSGSESFFSSKAIMESLKYGIDKAGLSLNSIQLIPTKDREAVGEMLNLNKYIDILVPRGGNSLIERVFKNTSIPLIAHLDGNCHTYVHKDADLELSKKIIKNAKLRRTSICGATESVLIDDEILESHLKPIVSELVNNGCEVRGDKKIQDLDPRINAASDEDWRKEYLDAIVSIKSTKNIDSAIKHIEKYGSNHTDAILTSNAKAAKKFITEVDSAIVMHNTSTQFADGGEFGLGAEIGISTGRLHARGPVGLDQLVTYKWVVIGQGQIRN
ncbi:glutamate-5-semialdehyde dehydrogenase [Alphaproteobacteria bacterium]|nr:glutamate-5-semialdehyde dehydrogenase [Alphaproteobacteria bacterium]